MQAWAHRGYEQMHEKDSRYDLSSKITSQPPPWLRICPSAPCSAQSTCGRDAAATDPHSASAPHRGRCPWPDPPEGTSPRLYACVYWCLTMSSHQRWRTSASRSERWCVLSRLCRVLGVTVFCSKRRSRSKTSWSGRSVSSTSSLSFCFRFQGLRFTRTHFETSALTCCVNPHSTRSWRSPGRGFPVPTHAGPGVPAERLSAAVGAEVLPASQRKGLAGEAPSTTTASLNSLSALSFNYVLFFLDIMLLHT